MLRFFKPTKRSRTDDVVETPEKRSAKDNSDDSNDDESITGTATSSAALADSSSSGSTGSKQAAGFSRNWLKDRKH